MKKTAGPINREAISPYDKYCDGYARPGSQGNGYVSVLKVATGAVEKTNDATIDGIVAYDRAEANTAYIGQINMETASSFCGIAGNVWGYDLARNPDIDDQKALFHVEQYDNSTLPIYDAKPLLDAGISLFGEESQRRFPPAPGSHVICANKSTTAYRPKDREPNVKIQSPTGKYASSEAYGVWCYIAISITRDRDNSADLFIEDSGLWTENASEADLKAYLAEHSRVVANSIVDCGKDQSVLYDRTYISFAYRIMAPGFVGTALTCAPYVTLAKNAVPGSNFDSLYDLTLPEWEGEVGLTS